MGELSKQLWALVAKLLPKQKVQGDGAIQVGKVSGDVKAVTQVVHQHFYPAPPLASEGGRSRVERFTGARPQTENAQPTVNLLPEQHNLAVSQILKARDQLKDKELAGFKRFMEREFQTQLVKAVPHAKLHRVQLYLDTTIRNRERTQ